MIDRGRIMLDAADEVRQFCSTLSVFGFTGVLALIVAALAVGGFRTIRRVTV